MSPVNLSASILEVPGSCKNQKFRHKFISMSLKIFPYSFLDANTRQRISKFKKKKERPVSHNNPYKKKNASDNII